MKTVFSSVLKFDGISLMVSNCTRGDYANVSTVRVQLSIGFCRHAKLSHHWLHRMRTCEDLRPQLLHIAVIVDTYDPLGTEQRVNSGEIRLI